MKNLQVLLVVLFVVFNIALHNHCHQFATLLALQHHSRMCVPAVLPLLRGLLVLVLLLIDYFPVVATRPLLDYLNQCFPHSFAFLFGSAVVIAIILDGFCLVVVLFVHTLRYFSDKCFPGCYRPAVFLVGFFVVKLRSALLATRSSVCQREPLELL